MPTHPAELPIPNSALKDESARELIRVWAAGGKQHVSMATGLWNDPAVWGIALVDLAKHVANYYNEAMNMDRKQTLERLRQGFDAEWNTPTDTPDGRIE